MKRRGWKYYLRALLPDRMNWVEATTLLVTITSACYTYEGSEILGGPRLLVTLYSRA